VTASVFSFGELACVTGRFQPPHRDHLCLLRQAAAGGTQLVVALTNPYPSSRRRFVQSTHRHRADANPFSFLERVDLLRAALAADGLTAERYMIVPFDLAAPETWPHLVPLHATQFVALKAEWERAKLELLAGAGYRTRALDAEQVGSLSSSAVREALSAGARGVWTEMVPPVTVALLDEFLRRKSLGKRTREQE
jgi:nicotinamide mononucleotide adenylyltransferase